MSESVLVGVCDDAYLPHLKALFVNCIRHGAWKGDFAAICQEQCNTSSIEARGINILRVPEKRCSMKFRLFSPYFQKWQRLLYFDCDSLVQGNLNKACDALARQFPAILCDGSQFNTILEDWKHFDKLAGTGPESHPEIYDRLKAKWPCVEGRLFGSSAFCFAPDSIPPGTVEAILAVQEEFKQANPGGYDQQVIGLVLNDRLVRAGKDFFIWWAFDDPGNRVPSQEKGWRGDESPVVLHYWSMYAPWLEKTPDAGAYYNHRLGRVCRELYAENLSLFDDTFPRTL